MKNQYPAPLQNALFASATGYSFPDGRSITIHESIFNAEYMGLIIQTAHEISRGKKRLFNVRYDNMARSLQFDNDHLAKDALWLLNYNFNDMRALFPYHRFNPYLDLFFFAAASFGVTSILCKRCYKSDMFLCAQRGNNFIEYIRSHANSDEFRKAINEYRRLPSKNYAGLKQYIGALFSKRSALLILRIDFTYRPFLNDQGDFVFPTYDEVKRNLKRLIMHLRKTFSVGDLAGYAWNLEYNFEKGPSHHFLILLDANLAQQAIVVAETLGIYWENIITDRKGLHYNCVTHDYKFHGTGIIHRSDEQARKNLLLAATYLTQIDYFLRLDVPNNGRTFGRGCMPKKKAAKRRKTTKSASVKALGSR